MLCFLSHFCEAHLTKGLREEHAKTTLKSVDKKIIKSRPLTVAMAMDHLAEVIAVPIKVRKDTIWLRTDIPPNAVKLMKSIGMKIPPKILQN